MLDKFVIIPTRKDQVIEANKICKFMYDSIITIKKILNSKYL